MLVSLSKLIVPTFVASVFAPIMFIQERNLPTPSIPPTPNSVATTQDKVDSPKPGKPLSLADLLREKIMKDQPEKSKEEVDQMVNDMLKARTALSNPELRAITPSGAPTPAFSTPQLVLSVPVPPQPEAVQPPQRVVQGVEWQPMPAIYSNPQNANTHNSHPKISSTGSVPQAQSQFVPPQFSQPQSSYAVPYNPQPRYAPNPNHQDPKQEYRQALRDAARRLEDTAAHLEEINGYEYGDLLREKAKEMRQAARDLN